jgi:hypothetical protein
MTDGERAAKALKGIEGKRLMNWTPDLGPRVKV